MRFEKRLIQLVRQNDILYNYYHPDYNKYPLRLVVWTGIADELGIDSKEAQKRWQNLRRVFRRIRIKIRETGRTPRSKWRHYDDMEFITEFDPAPGEQNIQDIKKGLKIEHDANEHMTALDDVKIEIFDDLSSIFEPSDYELHDSEILHSILIEPVPEETQPTDTSTTSINLDTQNEEHEINASIVIEEDENPATSPKPRRKPIANLTSTCSQNLAILGAKVDAITVPQRLKFELERKVADLVYEVLNKYSTEV